ncbi:MAG TPA: ATP-binding protein, partial [Dehalococcoidia bacterium]|nr:ATP-binding protein [Dehalococcoidia bacterium]
MGFVGRPVPLGHPDFGRAFPCQCVLNEGKERRLQRLLSYSNLGPLERLTFDNLAPQGRSADPSAREAFARAVAAARAFAQEPAGWLVFTGPSGCGKTHLAAAAANLCLRE